jgi:hypothetical protein
MDDTRRCTAKSRSGERCKRAAVIGAVICHMHGGNAPQVRAAAARRALQEDAARRLGHLMDNATPVEDPVGALMELGGKVQALVAALEQHVADLEHIGTIPGGRWGDQIAPEIGAYLGAIREAERVLSSLARLNLDERRVRLDERRAELVQLVIERVLAQHGVDPDAFDVRASVARQLQLAAAG